MGAYKRVFVSLSSVAAFLSVGALSASAFAQDPSAPPATTPAATPAVTITNAPAADGTVATPNAKDKAAGSDNDKIDKDNPPMKHIAIEANPFGILIGHYSAQLELMPWRHSSFIINPHFDHVSSDISSSAGGTTATYSESFTGFGTELGYRFYTGKTGPTGFYFGPSVLLGTYTASADAGLTGQGSASSSISFQQIGGALDIGGQAVVGPGVVIGAGFGLQYTTVNQSFQDLPLTASILAGGGIRPRFLFSIGYAL
jgi:hypothetical protein